MNRDSHIIDILKNTPWLCSVHFCTLVSGSDRQSLSNMLFSRTDPLWGIALSTFERDLLLLHDIDI